LITVNQGDLRKGPERDLEKKKKSFSIGNVGGGGFENQVRQPGDTGGSFSRKSFHPSGAHEEAETVGEISTNFVEAMEVWETQKPGVKPWQGTK